MPINAYALSSKLIHVGKMINNSHSCWFFILIKKYAAGYEITNVNKVIKNAYQNELSIIFKKVPFLKNSTYFLSVNALLLSFNEYQRINKIVKMTNRIIHSRYVIIKNIFLFFIFIRLILF